MFTQCKTAIDLLSRRTTMGVGVRTPASFFKRIKVSLFLENCESYRIDMKTKILRGDTAPFMNRDLRKGIYTRSRLQKKLKKHLSKEIEIKFTNQRNKCVPLRKKAIRNHFKSTTSNGLVSKQDFWNLIKPFLFNNGRLHGNDITLVNEDRIITDDKELVEVFNDHYINIVEKSPGKKPASIAENVPCIDDRSIVRLILQEYHNHPSVLTIIQSRENSFTTFSFQEVSADNFFRLLRAIY